MYLLCLCFLDFDMIVKCEGDKMCFKDFDLLWDYQLDLKFKRKIKLIKGFLKIDN